MDTPKELKKLASQLSKEWNAFGVGNVGTGYGYTDGVGSEIGWMLFVYANEPEKVRDKIPSDVNGIPVKIMNIPIAFEE